MPTAAQRKKKPQIDFPFLAASSLLKIVCPSTFQATVYERGPDWATLSKRF